MGACCTIPATTVFISNDINYTTTITTFSPPSFTKTSKNQHHRKYTIAAEIPGAINLEECINSF